MNCGVIDPVILILTSARLSSFVRKLHLIKTVLKLGTVKLTHM